MPNTLSPTWSLGDRIRKAREIHEWRQVDLAARLHIARSTLASWENLVHQPSYTDLEAIARATDVSVGWLRTGEATDVVPSWVDQLALFTYAAA